MTYTLSDAHRDGWTGEEAERFVKWMAAIDREIKRLCGLSADDLPDYAYGGNFLAGADPVEYAHEILADNGFPSDDETI